MTELRLNPNPKVSACVLVYNQVHLVRETLDALLSQDYENLEIVVGDDASTDGTQDVLREYATRYPGKVILKLNERNLGITGNSNVVFFTCTGDLITLIGGDDVCLPGKMTALVNEFEKDPEVTLAYHPVEIFDSLTNKTIYVTNMNAREDTNDALEIISRYGIAGGCGSAVMVKRSACPPDGFNVQIPTASDWMFFIEAALKGKVAKVDKVLTRYRKHAGNIGKKSEEYFGDFFLTLDLIEKKYPGNAALAKACKKGRARIMAGQGFGLLPSDRAAAREMFWRAYREHPRDLRYLFATLVSLFEYPSKIAFNAKYFIKGHLG